LIKPSHTGKQQQLQAVLLEAVTVHTVLIQERKHPDVQHEGKNQSKFMFKQSTARHLHISW